MEGYVYSMKFPSNKRYVGITTKKPRNRFKEHMTLAKTERKRKIYKAIRKYGEKNIEFEILETIQSEDVVSLFKYLCEKETYYIDKYDTFYNGYNCTKGGEGTVGMVGELNPFYGLKHKQETLSILSEKASKRRHTEETKRKIALAGKGRKHTEESIQKMRDNSNNKKVICLDTQEIFHSTCECSKKLGIARSDIRKVCEGKRITAHGMKFRFYENGSIKEVKEPRNNRVKKIMCVETKKKYSSIKDCCEDLNVRHQHVSAVLRGKQKTTKGYSFIYI